MGHMHDKGKAPPDKGKAPPDKGKAPPDKGRSGGGDQILGSVTRGAACVVLRASVESFGPPGDAELNLTVRWPAAALAAPCDCDDQSTATGTSGIDSEGNLHLPATFPDDNGRS